MLPQKMGDSGGGRWAMLPRHIAESERRCCQEGCLRGCGKPCRLRRRTWGNDSISASLIAGKAVLLRVGRVCADGAGRGLNGAHTRRRSGGRAWENARRAVGAQEETAVESARVFAPIVAICKRNVTGTAEPIVRKRVSINRLPQDDTPQSNRINGAGVCATRCHPQAQCYGDRGADCAKVRVNQPRGAG